MITRRDFLKTTSTSIAAAGRSFDWILVDGFDERELALGAVADLWTRQWQRRVSRGCERRHVGSRRHDPRQQRAGTRVATRTVPLHIVARHADHRHEWRRVNSHRDDDGRRLHVDGDD